jgi:hypothetical protein
LVAVPPSANLELGKSVSLLFNPGFFGRESTNDGLYTVGGAVIVSGLKSNAQYIASQASVQLPWQMTHHLRWFTGYGQSFPGEFIKQATPRRNINYWTGWLDIRYYAPSDAEPHPNSQRTWQKTAEGLYFRLQGFASTDAGGAQVLRLFFSTPLTDRQAALPGSLEFPPRGARRPPSDFRHTAI